MSLQRTVKWIDKTEARDKFCKSIQYSCRFLKLHFEQKGDIKNAKKFDSLFSAMRDARKLFRLFKTLNQYKKIQQILKKNTDINLINIMAILTRAFFGVYWIYDNLNILSKLKIIQSDPKQFARRGSLFWLLALLTNLFVVANQILMNQKKIQHLKRSYLSSSNQKEIQQKRKEYLISQKKRFPLALNLLKVLGDIIPAGQGSEMFLKLFGVTANDKLCGFGGLVSSLITCYQLYD